jgi:hypothetical protein
MTTLVDRVIAVTEAGPGVTAMALDVTSPSSVQAFAEQAAAMGVGAS